MSNALASGVITLYNHFRDPETRADRWQRTVLKGVQTRERLEKTVSTDGKLLLARSVSVTIPVSADAGGRRYLAPSAYAASEARERYWTLDAARGLDAIVDGACEAELGDGTTLDGLARERGVLTIRAVSDNTQRGRLRHWRVTAV